MFEPLLLRYFVMVVQLNSFSRAADALNTSQSVVSRGVKRLEDHVGAPLLVRNTRSMALTPAGTALYEEARDILSRLAIATDNARKIGAGAIAKIRLAICPTTESPEIARGIAAFREDWPDVDLQFELMMSDEQPQALRASHVDVGVMIGGGPPKGGIEWRVAFRPLVGVMLPSAWNFPADRPIDAADLADRPIILLNRAKAPAWYDAIVEICVRAGFQPRMAGIAEDPVIARIMIASGIGAMFGHSRGEFISQGGIQSMPLAGVPVFMPGETVIAWPEGASAPQSRALIACLIAAWRLPGR